MERVRRPIGVFDSGVGGISVLAQALQMLPNEDFIYYGDTKNAPYGDKSPQDVLRLTQQAVDKLTGMGCKAIVIACNTATSAAAGPLRQALELPIIGMEPALKPAAMLEGTGDVLVMATSMTLSQPKFLSLMDQYGQDAIPLACPGLMEFVERGELSGSGVEEVLQGLLAPYLDRRLKAVVLGCTHYVFLRKAIGALIGPKTPLIDGNLGTVLQLKRKLEHITALRQEPEHQGEVAFFTSAKPGENALAQMQAMLRLAMNN